ncbi:geranylgeranylglyceryl/heptaprenylglyceryl phosphate synthase [Xanthovirga aplysinae]|uniref:geranylgeranylglyceryl/heptaprenylglyceryl phosphate synthase n=1 Tax=Xanthovirga aplysinae TaxID=2529853 RepID=UPI0016572F5E|nr:geranylgeranylglyceryl/heptaprenylglyceryl phosphate synthase [Xanthovirga aplysinae]
MQKSKILKLLYRKKRIGQKSFAILIDPDKVEKPESCLRLIEMAAENQVDFFFVGGSLVTSDSQAGIIDLIQNNCDIPVILFPGSLMQLNFSADALLFLSLVSGRNPDLLIGQHVQAAPLLKKSALEILPTAYMLIDPGHPTSVSYMSQTAPIPKDKPSLAASTAQAAELLGMKLVYMDAGSGAKENISEEMIHTVSKSLDIPLIIGGGINSIEKAEKAFKAGADLIVIGNGIEKNPNLIIGVSNIVHYWKNSPLNV